MMWPVLNLLCLKMKAPISDASAFVSMAWHSRLLCAER